MARRNATPGYYYFDAAQVHVVVAGNYCFTTNSSMDTVGYLYIDSFTPAKMSRNLLLMDNDGGTQQQFKITQMLQRGSTYILVVTTKLPATRGIFTIIDQGPTNVMYSHYEVPTSSAISLKTMFLSTFFKLLPFILFLYNYSIY